MFPTIGPSDQPILTQHQADIERKQLQETTKKTVPCENKIPCKSEMTIHGASSDSIHQRKAETIHDRVTFELNLDDNSTKIKFHTLPDSAEQFKYQELLSYSYGHIKSHDGGRLSILGIACGTGQEIIAAHNAFSAHDTFIIGIDINRQLIDKGNSRLQEHNIKNARLMIKDLSKTDSSFHKTQDLVLMRGPEPFENDICESTRIWAEIFNNAQSTLKDGGVLLITSYFEDEMFFFVDRINSTVNIISSGKNPFFSSDILTDSKGVKFGRDLFFALLQRKQ